MDKNLENKSFEESLDTLEAITESLKDGNIPLKDMLKLYEEGIKYYKICYDILNSAKQQIEVYDKELETIRKEI